MNINLQSFRDGDQLVFKKVFDDMFPQMKGFMIGKYRLESLEDIEDCITEAFCNLYIYRHKVKSYGDIRRFLFIRVKTNMWLVFNKKKSYGKTTVYGEKSLEAAIVRGHYYADDPVLERMDYQRICRMLGNAIEKLPNMRRSVIKSLLLGYDSNRIAEVLGIDRQTVLNHKTKAIQQLAGMLV